MIFFLNGQEMTLCQPLTITQLLAQENLQEKRIAVEVNRTIVPKSQHAQYILSENDRIEIVHALGGG